MLEDVAVGLEQVLDTFNPVFKTKTHCLTTKVYSYIRGLFKSEKNRANCTSIADSLGELNHQSFNHLLCDSPWNYQQVLMELSIRANTLLNDYQDVGLLIDEVGFRKKGNHSACVSRQYLGCIGKQDNGQVAVVSGLSVGSHYCPINVHLYMPNNWANDSKRRAKAKIPEHINFQTKPQLALSMIKEAKSNGVRFNYVAFDALYGNSLDLICTLNEEKIEFIGDVKGNIQIYTEVPCFKEIEQKQNSRGRKQKYPQATQKVISVETYKNKLDVAKDFEKIAFRNGTKQSIAAHFHKKKIWICTDKKSGKVIELQLIIRKDTDGTVKYSIANMRNKPLKQIAQRQGQRVFVEKIFEEGKNQLAMGDYQVRSWEGFHKHITLSFLAFYYVAYQKVKNYKILPLTAPVIRKLVASTIISKWQSLNDTLDLCLKHLTHYNHHKIRYLNSYAET